MELHFVEGRGSKPDLHAGGFLGWRNKVMGTESDKKVCEKRTMRSFVHG